MSDKYDNLESKSKKTLEHFKKELGRLRTGRAAPSLLETIQVDYYGSMVPLQQVGMVNAPEPRMLTIQVYDASAIEGIEKAIQQSDLGLTPQRDGNLIRINIPSLTEDRRKDLIKKVHKMAEETRVTLRTHRREGIDFLKKQEKSKAISADDVRRGETEIQKIIDKSIADVDVVVTAKEKELMEV